MRDDATYLRYIADCIDRVEEYLTKPEGELDKGVFYTDSRTQDAVLRRMEMLADAEGHLSSAIKERHHTVPWRQIAAFRNVLAHGYIGIRLDRVWEVITEDLPTLKAVTIDELLQRG